MAALHYLIKPVKREQLWSVLVRAAERLKKNEKELLLKTADETVVMPVREIRYLDVQQNYPGEVIKLKSFEVQGVARHVIKAL